MSKSQKIAGVVVAAVSAATILTATAFSPLLGLMATGGVALFIGAVVLGYRYIWSVEEKTDARVVMGRTEVVIRCVRLPREINKDLLMTGLADYIMRGLRDKALPQLADYHGPEVPLTSPEPQAAAPVVAETASAPVPQAPGEATLPAAPKANNGQTPAGAEATPQQQAAGAPANSPVAPGPDAPEPLTREEIREEGDAPDICEICRGDQAGVVGTVEVWDGEGLLRVYTCRECGDLCHEQADANGHPALWKRNDQGQLVPHNKAPVRKREEKKDGGEKRRRKERKEEEVPAT